MNFKKWLLLTEAKKSSDIAKELLDNDDNLLKEIKSIIPTDIPEKLQSQLLPIAAYYYKQQPNINTLKQDIQDFANLVKLNKMQIITVNDDLTINNDFKSYLHWTEIIHGKQHQDKVFNAPIQNITDQKIIAKSQNNKIIVYEANSVNQCIILGKGQKFCISQPANTMFQSYRDTKISTFYFVYDNTRTDDLSIVVIDATENDGIQLTDRQNQTGHTMQDPYSTERIKSDPDLYFKYLQENGIDTTIFKNIPKSPSENAEHAKLGKEIQDLDWFKSLTSEEKSKYIGRGHKLSNPQFDYLYDNNLKFFLTQYVKIGNKVNNYQLAKIAVQKDLKDNYLHNRLITTQQFDNISKKEFELLMNSKQKEEYYTTGDVTIKLTKAIEFDNFEMVKYLIEKKAAKINNDSSVSDAASIGNLEMVTYLVNKGAKIPYYAVMAASENGHLDVIKYLLGDEVRDKQGNILKLPEGTKIAEIGKSAVAHAAANGYFDVVKYLIKEKSAYIGRTSVSNSAAKGYFEIIKYLVEKGAKISDVDVDKASTQEIKDYLSHELQKRTQK